jgi:hypothetical protein
MTGPWWAFVLIAATLGGAAFGYVCGFSDGVSEARWKRLRTWLADKAPPTNQEHGEG